MRLINFWYECKNCKTYFKSPEAKGSYGDFLLRNKIGNIAYLDAISCSAYSEFSNFLKENKCVANMEKNKWVEILQTIFGLICDQSNKENYYSITQDPRCPSCGHSKYAHWGPTNPPEIVDVDVNELTFIKWNSLTVAEKEEQVGQAIEMYPLIKTYQEGIQY